MIDFTLSYVTTNNVHRCIHQAAKWEPTSSFSPRSYYRYFLASAHRCRRVNV